MKTARQPKKRVFFMLLSMVLCVCLAASTAAPVRADSLSGDWEKIRIDDMNLYALVLDSRLNGVTAFDLAIEVEMKAGARCENWDVWARSSRAGSFQKIGYIYLEGGTGEAFKTIRLSNAMNIDAVAVTPTASGGFSWSMSMGISNPSYGSASQSSGSVSSGAYLAGDWVLEKVDRYNVYAYVLDSKLTGVTAFDLAVDVEMKAGARCENWDVWVRSSRSGSFKKVGYFYLEDGTGEASKTIYLSDATNIDAVTVTPTASGGFSWTLSMGISNPSYGTFSDDDFGGYLGGDWEEVTLNDNGSSFTTYAYALRSTLRNCSSFDVDMEVEMKANTRCQDWDVWVRSNGRFYKVDEIYLYDGTGEVSQTVWLSPARNVDAVAIVPAVDGGYSWTISLGIYNPN